MSIKILSFDPGQKNFAWAVTEHKLDAANQIKSRVLHNGKLLKPVVDYIESKYEGAVVAFLQEMRGITSTFGPYDGIALERYMGRGVKTAAAEASNVMIGLTTMVSLNIHDKVPLMVNPASWKNAYNRQQEEETLDTTYKLIWTEPHQWDAVLIGVYYAAKLFDVTPFLGFNSGQRNRLMLETEQTSTEKLYRRRTLRSTHTREVLK